MRKLQKALENLSRQKRALEATFASPGYKFDPHQTLEAATSLIASFLVVVRSAFPAFTPNEPDLLPNLSHLGWV